MGNGIGDLKNVTATASARVSVDTQRQMLNQLRSVPSFEGLRNNSDASSQAFVAQMDGFRSQISSPAYEEVVKQQFASAAADSPGISTDAVRDQVKKLFEESPMLKTVLSNIALVVSIGLLFSFLFLNSLVIKPLAGIFGWISAIVFSALSKTLASRAQAAE
ncbi:MAG: hypothetical protein Q7R47_02505 [Candidatus Diapherotrites archaeon]|nr:hypothetical protein [Candidatus Diapherotrites archaeon]